MAHMETEFGAPTSLEDFERKAQMLDYVGHRAIFEGFAAHLWQPNSARMIWMTQPSWPSMEWNFLSWDYDTQSSFYGTEKACEPVHAQLNLSDGSVDLINLGEARSFKVRTLVESLDGKTLERSDQPGASRSRRSHCRSETRLGKFGRRTYGLSEARSERREWCAGERQLLLVGGGRSELSRAELASASNTFGFCDVSNQPTVNAQ